MSVINRAYSLGLAASVASKARAAVRGLVDQIALWEDRATSRHRLGQIDDWMLKDVGLTRADVARESGKPFWRP